MGAVVASFTKSSQLCQVLLRTAKKICQSVVEEGMGEGGER